jgi:uracil-DNA glycosylase
MHSVVSSWSKLLSRCSWRSWWVFSQRFFNPHERPPRIERLGSAESRDRQLRALPAAAKILPAGGAGKADRVSRLGLLGSAGPEFRRSAGPVADRRTGAGRARREAGFANQPASTSHDDGLRLSDCAITAAAHCAPPGNKPLPGELANCRDWLERTIDELPLVVLLALGQIAWRAVVAAARRRTWHAGPMPRFGHLAQVKLAGERWLLGSYHPSQQNTQTGVLTEAMFDRVFRVAGKLLKSA